jgi:hypothetical protein
MYVYPKKVHLLSCSVIKGNQYLLQVETEGIGDVHKRL